MRKNVIFKKLFFMALGIIIVLAVTQYLLQFFWLDDFYFNEQEKKAFEALEEIISLVEHDENMVLDSLIDYSKNQGTHIGVFNEDGDFIYRDRNSPFPPLLIEEYNRLYSDNSFKQTVDMESTLTYTQIDEVTSIDYLVIIQRESFAGDDNLYFIVMKSIQPMYDIFFIIQRYFTLILIVVVSIAVIFTYFISKSITKPLIHMNEITNKLAMLDFSERCEVNTKDEIEGLSDNINTMSTKLQDALKALEQDIADKDKLEQFRKRFIADISHELKTPITIAKGISEGLVDGVYEDNVEQHKRVLNELKTMDRLVYDLLELSKMDFGEDVLNKNIFQFSDVVLKIHNQVKPLRIEKNIHVNLDLDEDFCHGDEKKLEQVLRNLYTNALRYTKEGGIINIDVNKHADSLLVSIENQPAHIPENEIEQITLPFYRVEKSRNKAHGGTGLGLYIVKSILEQHQTKLDIKNTEEGVCISFELDIVHDTVWLE